MATMVPFQVPVGPEILIIAIAIGLLALIGVLGGLGYYFLRIRPG